MPEIIWLYPLLHQLFSTSCEWYVKFSRYNLHSDFTNGIFPFDHCSWPGPFQSLNVQQHLNGSIRGFRQQLAPGLFALAKEPVSPADKNSKNVKPDNIGGQKRIHFCILRDHRQSFLHFPLEQLPNFCHPTTTPGRLVLSGVSLPYLSAGFILVKQEEKGYFLLPQ